MKLSTIPLLAGAVLACTQAPAQKLEFKEQLRKEFSLSQSAGASTLAIYNINGFIKVEGYSGDKVVMEIDKKITASGTDALETGKNEFKIEFEQKPDSLIAYIANPFDSRPNRGRYNRNEKQIHYNFELSFTVKVPYSPNLQVSTVNGGDVEVRDVTGSLGINNVNGAVKVTNAKGLAKVQTVNGNVEANFVTLPSGASDFKTLNGDIKVTYPPALSADCQFKSFNGAFYTDFPNAEQLPVRVVKNLENNQNKTLYRLNTETFIRIGSGGATYKFETFNGNIYLKKQS